MTVKGDRGHEWTDGLTHCVRCGVRLVDYEKGKPYECGIVMRAMHRKIDSEAALVGPDEEGRFRRMGP